MSLAVVLLMNPICLILMPCQTLIRAREESSNQRGELSGLGLYRWGHETAGAAYFQQYHLYASTT
jgi:hypothetical protein